MTLSTPALDPELIADTANALNDWPWPYTQQALWVGWKDRCGGGLLHDGQARLKR